MVLTSIEYLILNLSDNRLMFAHNVPVEDPFGVVAYRKSWHSVGLMRNLPQCGVYTDYEQAKRDLVDAQQQHPDKRFELGWVEVRKILSRPQYTGASDR